MTDTPESRPAELCRRSILRLVAGAAGAATALPVVTRDVLAQQKQAKKAVA